MRRSVLVSAALAATVLGTASARAECLMPGPAPAPPRGAVATLDDMKVAHQALQDYVNALEAFQKCRDDEIKHAPAGTTAQMKRAWAVQGDAAIDLAHRVADVYKQQYQIFKVRNPGVEQAEAAKSTTKAKPKAK